MKSISRIVGATMIFGAILLLAIPAQAFFQFNGQGDNQTDVLGYYYIITGGNSPRGISPMAITAWGAHFRFLIDDPAWGHTLDTWQKDDWFPDNAGFALTLKNSGAIVYDNNGIEDGTYGDYYDASGSHGTHGLYRGYSMSNNFDWIYAGYFNLEQTTTFDQIIGYFDPNGNSSDTFPFKPNSPAIHFRMNIWSNVTGSLMPANTGNFTGDILSTDNVQGSFSWGDTGVDRVYPDVAGFPEAIYRLVFTPKSPITLQPGIYWFSHDAAILPVATSKEACKNSNR